MDLQYTVACEKILHSNDNEGVGIGTTLNPIVLQSSKPNPGAITPETLARNNVPFIDAEEQPLRTALDLLQLRINNGTTYSSEFDQQPNLREMINYTKNLFGNEKTANELKNEHKCLNHLDSCIQPIPKYKFTLGRLAQSAAIYDFVSDCFGVETFWNEGYSEINIMFFIISILVLIVGVFAENCRVAFIGKEAYNLRKFFICSLLTKDQFKIYPEYENEWLVDLWKNPIHFIVSRTRGRFYYYLHCYGQERPNESVPVLSMNEFIDQIQNLEIRDEIRLIYERMPSIHRVGFNCFPSVSLNNAVIRNSSKLNELLKTRTKENGKLTTSLEYLQLFYTSIFLQFIAFSSAEMNLTELMLENTPQLFLRIVRILQAILKNGLGYEYRKLGFFGTVSSILPLLTAAFTLCHATLGKIGYYFAVYNQGKEFTRPGLIMPDYGKLNLLLTTISHGLTIGSVLAIAALSCVSLKSSTLTITIFILSVTRMFWIKSAIPFYSIYYSWSMALTSFHFSRAELTLPSLMNQTVRKLGFFSGLLVLNGFILSLDSVYGNHIFTTVGTIWGFYVFGLVLQLFNRYLWKYEWGEENFSKYTNSYVELELNKVL